MLWFLWHFFTEKPRSFLSSLGEEKGRDSGSHIRLVATDCPGCVFQLRAGLKPQEIPFEIRHTAELVARAVQNKETVAEENG